MATRADPETRTIRRRSARPLSWPAWGVLVALALIVLAMVVPVATSWKVHALSFPPLHAQWQPRFGPGTLPSIAAGLAALAWAPGLAARLSWPRLLWTALLGGLAWMVSLASVDGLAGLGSILATRDEYLRTARRVTDISGVLHEFVCRIPSGATHPWSIQVAGHPPGALLFFVGLTRFGLGSDLGAGLSVVVLAATIPIAVLITVRRLAGDAAARRVAPLLVIGPSAVWLAVSADAVFSCVAAWGLCLLAISATDRRNAVRRIAATAAGLLLGCCAMLSYGLPLVGVLALGVLVAARDARPLRMAVPAAAAVVLAFVPFGFAWWDAYPALRERYYAGTASVRPASYWLWGDLAALTLSAGPVLGASVALAVRRFRGLRHAPRASRPLLVLTVAASTCIALADASLMSKAETERIWLPFVPWLLLAVGLLPDRWRRRALGGQIVLAFAIQTLLATTW